MEEANLSDRPCSVVKTAYKVGNTTYIVSASSSQKATDTIEKKIKKLIRKDISEKQ